MEAKSSIIDVRIIETEGVKFTYREIDLGVLYSFTPMSTTCEVVETLAGVYEELEEVWYNYDIMIDYSPEEVKGTISRDLGKVIALVLDELKEGKQLGETITAIHFFIRFDVEQVLDILRRVQSVTRVFDGYGYCYLMQLRDE